MNDQNWIHIFNEIFKSKNIDEIDLTLSKGRIKNCSESDYDERTLKEGSNLEKYWILLKNGLKRLKIPSKCLFSLNPVEELAKIIIFCDSYSQEELKKIFSDDKSLEIIEIWKKFFYRHLINIEEYCTHKNKNNLANKQELLEIILTSTDRFIKNKEKFRSHYISQKNKIWSMNKQKIKIFVNKEDYGLLKGNGSWINKFIYEHDKVPFGNFFIISNELLDFLLEETEENIQINTEKCFSLMKNRENFLTKCIHRSPEETEEIPKKLEKMFYKKNIFNINLSLTINNYFSIFHKFF